MSRHDDDLHRWLADYGAPPGSGSDPAGGEGAPPPAATVPPPDAALGDLAGAGPPPAVADRPPGWPPGAAPPDPSPARAWRLWALAALPWALIAVVAVAAWTGLPGGSSADDAGAGSGGGGGAGAAGDAGDADAGGEGAGTRQRPGPGDGEPGATPEPATEPGAPGGAAVEVEVAHLAEVAVRRAGAAALADAEDTPVHVDHARAVRAVELGAGTLVTVAALVRRAEDGAWSAPVPARFGVALDGQGRLREPPWPLAARVDAGAAADPAAFEALDLDGAADLAAAAAEALAAAGYTDVELTGLQRVDDDLALRAEVRARPPAGSARGAHVAWLAADAGRVLGAPGEIPELETDDDRSDP